MNKKDLSAKKNKLLQWQDQKLTAYEKALEFYADPEKLVREFHRLYETFAEVNKWDTQEKCKVDYDALPDENRRTMFGTCRAIGKLAREVLKDE